MWRSIRSSAGPKLARSASVEHCRLAPGRGHRAASDRRRPPTAVVTRPTSSPPRRSWDDPQQHRGEHQPVAGSPGRAARLFQRRPISELPRLRRGEGGDAARRLRRQLRPAHCAESQLRPGEPLPDESQYLTTGVIASAAAPREDRCTAAQRPFLVKNEACLVAVAASAGSRADAGPRRPNPAGRPVRQAPPHLRRCAGPGAARAVAHSTFSLSRRTRRRM